MAQHSNAWPSLRVDDWAPTRETLHMWTQIVGQVRLAYSPMVNHWWQVTMYVTPREPKSVAEFYSQTMRALDELGFSMRIQSHPNEVDPAPPFAGDVEHASYDPHATNLFWRQLLQANRVLAQFRSRFMGKVSPVHFFWGAMDLACTRFSGRGAPRHPGGAPNVGDWVMVEGYSRELSSCGFFPGGGDEGAFYAYAYPEPDGFDDHPVSLPEANYSKDLGEYLLPYEAVRQATDSDRTLLGFLQETYEAAAVHASWDRAALEDDPDRWKAYQTPA